MEMDTEWMKQELQALRSTINYALTGLSDLSANMRQPGTGNELWTGVSDEARAQAERVYEYKFQELKRLTEEQGKLVDKVLSLCERQNEKIDKQDEKIAELSKRIEQLAQVQPVQHNHWSFPTSPMGPYFTSEPSWTPSKGDIVMCANTIKEAVKEKDDIYKLESELPF